jgi:hypothetical protein
METATPTSANPTWLPQSTTETIDYMLPLLFKVALALVLTYVCARLTGAILTEVKRALFLSGTTMAIGVAVVAVMAMSGGLPTRWFTSCGLFVAETEAWLPKDGGVLGKASALLVSGLSQVCKAFPSV